VRVPMMETRIPKMLVLRMTRTPWCQFRAPPHSFTSRNAVRDLMIDRRNCGRFVARADGLAAPQNETGRLW